MIKDIESIDWQSAFIAKPYSCKFDIFYAKLSEIVDRHIPLKELSRKKIKLQLKPWITPALKVYL